MKFGGTSVEDGVAYDRVSNIVRSQLQSPAVVVASAMSGVTDALMLSQETAAAGKPVEATLALEGHFERHLRVAAGLSGAALSDVADLIDEARRDLREAHADTAASGVTTFERQDTITSYGERLSAALLTKVLEHQGVPATYVDARQCILTNEEHGNARPLNRETERHTRAAIIPLLEAGRVPVLGGFIASTRRGITTTLGRGSSDYTATLVGAALDAREIQIWTDVDGVLTADPAIVEAPRTVIQLHYSEAAELARLGARVMHPKMLQPLLEKRIPVRIGNSRAPERAGTLVGAQKNATASRVKAIAHQSKLVRIDIESTPAHVANGFWHSIRKSFNRYRCQLEVVAKSETGVSVACAESPDFESLIRELEEIGAIQINKQCALISCVGEGLRQSRDEIDRLTNLAANADPALTWHSTSRLNLIVVVREDIVRPIIRQLHKEIFESGAIDERSHSTTA
jgi:aspartate kinase